MQSVSPVFTSDEVQFEKKIAEHQAEYMTVIGLPVGLDLVDRASGARTMVSPWGTSFRFRLSDAERAAVAEGRDLILTQLNFGQEITPMNVQFCAIGEKPFFGERPAVSNADELHCPICMRQQAGEDFESDQPPAHKLGTLEHPVSVEQPRLRADHASLNDDGTISISTATDKTITLIDPHQGSPSAEDLDAVEAESTSVAQADGNSE